MMNGGVHPSIDHIQWTLSRSQFEFNSICGHPHEHQVPIDSISQNNNFVMERDEQK